MAFANLKHLELPINTRNTLFFVDRRLGISRVSTSSFGFIFFSQFGPSRDDQKTSENCWGRGWRVALIEYLYPPHQAHPPFFLCFICHEQRLFVIVSHHSLELLVSPSSLSEWRFACVKLTHKAESRALAKENETRESMTKNEKLSRFRKYRPTFSRWAHNGHRRSDYWMENTIHPLIVDTMPLQRVERLRCSL